MPDKDVQVLLRDVNGLPEDVYINVLHFNINAPDTIEGTCDDINAAYATLLPVLSGRIASMTIKVYPPGINPTGPEFTKDYVFDPAQSPAPNELACCLSYATVDDPEQSTARRRGRIYVGPLAASAVNADRPDSILRDFILDFGELLGSAGNAGNSTWRMKSQVDNVYATIESIWVDDAWDVQRRRGLAPTLRDTRDVQ
jgi:hypothetical protein